MLRYDSGIASQSSPVSMLFLASDFILARLLHVRSVFRFRKSQHRPVLKPNLHRSFSHVDLLRNPLANGGGRSSILCKLDLEQVQLILRRSLPLLVLLLLCKSALPWRASRRIGGRSVLGAGHGGGCARAIVGRSGRRRSGCRHFVRVSPRHQLDYTLSSVSVCCCKVGVLCLARATRGELRVCWREIRSSSGVKSLFFRDCN
jgi:hypothetical protein